MAAGSELIVDALEVLVDGEHVVVAVGELLVGTLKGEVLCRHRLVLLGSVLQMVAHSHVAFDDLVGIELAVGDLSVEVRRLLEAHLLDEMPHDALLDLHLLILKAALEQLLGVESVLGLRLFQCQANLGFSLRGLHDVQPVALRTLVALRDDLHTVARVKFLSHGDHFSVDTSAHTAVADFGVDAVGEVEHRHAGGELKEVALRREGVDLVGSQVHAELIHDLQSVSGFERRAYVGEPLVHLSSALDTLVAPMRGETVLGDVVHALSTYLHLHPFVLRSEHGDVEALVAIALRHAEPVAQSFRVGLVHIGDDGVDLPALLFLLF